MFDIFNLIDLVVIVLYYFDWVLDDFDVKKYLEDVDGLWLLRVFRLFKLVRYFDEFKVFVKIVCLMWWEFCMILFFIFIIIVIFFGWIFYVEYEV